jgi:hypothetical protein
MERFEQFLWWTLCLLSVTLLLYGLSLPWKARTKDTSRGERTSGMYQEPRDTLGADQRQDDADERALRWEHSRLLKEHQRSLQARLLELEDHVACQESLRLHVAQCLEVCRDPVVPCPVYCLDILNALQPNWDGER